MTAFAKASAVNGSTSRKQTSKGLFIFTPEHPRRGYDIHSALLSSPPQAGDWGILGFYELKSQNPPIPKSSISYQALISTSTPLGRSNFESASTVREEEV